MAGKTILGIAYRQSRGTLYDATELYCRQFRARGAPAELIDLDDRAAIQRMNALLQTRSVAFAFGLQGSGAKLEDSDGENLWLAARVPFLCLHGDGPCHNPLLHAHDSPYVANLYFAASFLEEKQRYLPNSQIAGLLPLELRDIPSAPPTPFAARPIRLLYLKNGAPLTPLEESLRRLPPPLHDGVRDQLARAAHDPNLSLGDLAQEIFTRNSLDREDHHGLFWSIAQTMELWLRRKRAIDFVNWLKFQDGAHIIGDGWEFIDRAGSRATFRPSVPSRDTAQLYAQAQFTCNTSPYGRDILHERILHGMLMESCVLSDSNAWIDQNMAAIPALTRFNGSQPLDAQLQPVLQDPDAARHAATGRAAIIARFQPDKLPDRMIAGAQEITAALDQIAQEETVL